MREFVLELDRPRRLVFDFDAWDRIAEKFVPEKGGKFDIYSVDVSALNIPFFVYAGLAWADAEMTEAQAKVLVNKKIQEGVYTVLDLMKIVVEALFAQAGFKIPEKGEGKETEKKDGAAQKKARTPRPKIPTSRKSG